MIVVYTLTYVFSEGKVCIADQDLSLVVSLKGVYTFFWGGGDRSHGTSQVFYYWYYHNCMKPLGNAYAMEVSLIEKNMLMIIEYVICIGKT